MVLVADIEEVFSEVIHDIGNRDRQAQLPRFDKACWLVKAYFPVDLIRNASLKVSRHCLASSWSTSCLTSEHRERSLVIDSKSGRAEPFNPR